MSDSLVIPWNPLSLGFPRQEYCSGLPFPPRGDPGIEPLSPKMAGGFFTVELPRKPQHVDFAPYLVWLSTTGELLSFRVLSRLQPYDSTKKHRFIEAF